MVKAEIDARIITLTGVLNTLQGVDSVKLITKTIPNRSNNAVASKSFEDNQLRIAC